MIKPVIQVKERGKKILVNVVLYQWFKILIIQAASISNPTTTSLETILLLSCKMNEI